MLKSLTLPGSRGITVLSSETDKNWGRIRGNHSKTIAEFPGRYLEFGSEFLLKITRYSLGSKSTANRTILISNTTAITRRLDTVRVR